MKHSKLVTRTFAGILLIVSALAGWSTAKAQAISQEEVAKRKEYTQIACENIRTWALPMYNSAATFKENPQPVTSQERMLLPDTSPLGMANRAMQKEMARLLKEVPMTDQEKLDLQRTASLTYTFMKNNEKIMFVLERDNFLKLIDQECLATVHKYPRKMVN